MAIVSQRAYARHRGVALAAVQKALATGRITMQEGGIDPEQADRDWEENTTQRAPSIVNRSQEDDEGSNFGASQYTKARAVREHYHARIAKLEYEERVAKLVSKDEVQLAAFNQFRMFRDGMLNIPDRLAAVLAAETDPARVHELLAAEIRKALQEFADGSR